MTETLSKEQKRLRKNEIQKKYQKNNKKKVASMIRDWSHKNKDKILKKAKKVYHKDKTKALARAKTSYSNEKTGECLDCGLRGKTEFHHLSYEPNIFIELCKICHNVRHGRKTWIV